jgi:hypothetical protein
MNRPRYLTKSRFKLAAECPTKLLYAGKEDVYRNTKQGGNFMAMPTSSPQPSAYPGMAQRTSRRRLSGA